MDKDGDVIIDGTVTADLGRIGGWTLADKYLLANSENIAFFGSGSRAGSINIGPKANPVSAPYQNVINAAFKDSGSGMWFSGSGEFRLGGAVKTNPTQDSI